MARAEDFGVVSVHTAVPHKATSIMKEHFSAACQRNKKGVLMAFK